MIYTAILKLNTIVSDYSEDQGDFPTITSKILKANRQPIEFYAVPYLNHEFYFLHKDDYTFASICESHLDNERVLIFLQNLRQKYFTLCKDEKENLTLKATSLIRDLMLSHCDVKTNEDKFDKIERDLDLIKKEKFEIIEKTIEKDLLINTISKKSENLKTASFEMKYKVKSKLDKNKKTNFKFYLGTVLVLFVLFGYFSYHNFYEEKKETKFLK